MRQVIVATIVALAFGTGCDAPKQEEPAKATKAELKQATEKKMSDAELEAERRKAGFIPLEEQAADNMAAMEKGEREYVKRRVDKYKEMLKRIRELLDGVEKEAAKWAKAKDPQKAFEAFAKTYQEDMKEFLKGYNELTEGGVRGGNFQAKISAAIREWEGLNNSLAADSSGKDEFKAALKATRDGLDGVDKELEAIEKDATLDISGEEGKEGDTKAGDTKAGDTKAGDAKADDKKADDKKADDKKADDKKADAKGAG